MPIFRVFVLACLLALPAWAQTLASSPAPRGTYLLGTDDIISIHATDADEVSDKAIRIGPGGFINLPMVGRIKAAGMSVEDLEKELTVRLKPFIRQPEVAVNIVELRSQPVSVIGEVSSPGILQLQGKKTLVEALSMAGGLRGESGYSVKITRRKEWGPIPLPNATTDPTGEFSVAEVSLRDIMEARDPAANILIMPNDVISVPRAEMVYVIGEVKRAGGFVLGDKAHMSVLQAMSMAAGLDRNAYASRSRVLRFRDGSATRSEIPVNVERILAGKDQDVPLQPDDILFVPSNKTKAAALKAVEAMIQAGTGVAIYRGGN